MKNPNYISDSQYKQKLNKILKSFTNFNQSQQKIQEKQKNNIKQKINKIKFKNYYEYLRDIYKQILKKAQKWQRQQGIMTSNQNKIKSKSTFKIIQNIVQQEKVQIRLLKYLKKKQQNIELLKSKKIEQQMKQCNTSLNITKKSKNLIQKPIYDRYEQTMLLIIQKQQILTFKTFLKKFPYDNLQFEKYSQKSFYFFIILFMI